MTAEIKANSQKRKPLAAFSLTEVMVAMGLLAVVIGALYSSVAFGFSSVRLNDENLRATEIMTEKMEVLRLCGWNRLASGAISTNFTASFCDSNATNSLTYQGIITVSAPPITEFYSNDLKKVTISLRWTSDNISHSRSQTTLVSTNGLQTYIY